MAVLLAYGTDVYSFVGPNGSVSGWLSIGTAPSGAVPGAVPSHNDGILGIYSAANEVTAAFAVDLGAAKVPIFAAFFNHNITVPAAVRVQASASPNFGVLLMDVAVTLHTTNPNFWKDLRSVAPSGGARYWRGLVTGNSTAVKLGEFVVADADSLQSYQWNYTDIRDYLEHLKGVTDHGVRERVKQRIRIRARAVRWVGPDTIEAALRAVSDRIGVLPGPVIFIPDDTDESDVWFLDWQDTYTAKAVIENRQEVLLTLQEQSPGSLT